MTRSWVTTSAAAQIRASAAESDPLETGGLLLGYIAPDGVAVVLEVTGPGPSAVHQKSSFEPDHEWQQSELARRYAASDGVLGYVGDWHSHPGGLAIPSWQDLGTMKRISRYAEARISHPLMGLIDVHAGQPGQLRLWRWAPVGVAGLWVWQRAVETEVVVTGG